MIGKLSGRIDSVGEEQAILDVGGVGYLVFASSRTLGLLPSRGEAASLLIETHVREDHIHLYGFLEAAERDWFRLLSTVQGVGSRSALAILSVLSPLQLAQAIAAQDKAAVSRANGVGPKLAARICAELKDKAGRIALASELPGRGRAVADGTAAPSAPNAEAAAAAEDAVSALEALGYKRGEAFAAVAQAARNLGSEAPLEELIKGGLRELAR
ncbi:Holliday junction DNA helicase subunit RuvA [Tistlia consotensis]|uniref:Holliday junction branch migration complex subunit RuvA n=1 Tax=Tistlia consotensis USBA 355 TaxID=560819 RepID=A0A1Y6C2P5_9PROT|nr:Holliday junction branch migration protein RuvA [Tistlia consotensis]SMF32734.1 Holliday junction DNA helicase subunit RuvA [Tistlia consotensis USBA 355]SNR68895.1 Holliday junction DNA helicase subunit RuvA [Tistlia consotensis]